MSQLLLPCNQFKNNSSLLFRKVQVIYNTLLSTIQNRSSWRETLSNQVSRHSSHFEFMSLSKLEWNHSNSSIFFLSTRCEIDFTWLQFVWKDYVTDLSRRLALCWVRIVLTHTHKQPDDDHSVYTLLIRHSLEANWKLIGSYSLTPSPVKNVCERKHAALKCFVEQTLWKNVKANRFLYFSHPKFSALGTKCSEFL